MDAVVFVQLIEEMVSLKAQEQAEAYLKPPPEILDILVSKRINDRRRLAQIRMELVRMLGG